MVLDLKANSSKVGQTNTIHGTSSSKNYADNKLILLT